MRSWYQRHAITWAVAVAGAQISLGSAQLSGQTRQSSFSGDWVLVDVSSASNRSSGQSGGSRTAVNTLSGAAFNCGRGCTLVHAGGALRVEGALLGTEDRPAPAVTLQLNGEQATVIDSSFLDAPHTISALARLVDRNIEIVSRGSITQRLAIQEGQLIVTSFFNGAPRETTTTLRYRRR